MLGVDSHLKRSRGLYIYLICHTAPSTSALKTIPSLDYTRMQEVTETGGRF